VVSGAAAAKRAGGARAPSKAGAIKAAARKTWIPERQDVIWIDVIGLPMTTAAYNATNPFALAVGAAGGRKTGKTSYVLCHQPKSFDWRARRAKPHPQGQLADAAFATACAVLNQIISIE
jgi:mRNA interferase MazF